MSTGSELLGYTNAAIRQLQGDAGSTLDNAEAGGSGSSVTSRVNLPVSRSPKHSIALPLGTTIHLLGTALEDRHTRSNQSSPPREGGHGSSTLLANSSPLRDSITPQSLSGSPSLPVPATVKLSSKKVREICSPYSADQNIPLESRKGNKKQIHGSHLRHQSLRQGVLQSMQERASQLDTSDDNIMISVTEQSDSCKIVKQKLLEKQSAEQEACQMIVTPVIVSHQENDTSASWEKGRSGHFPTQCKPSASRDYSGGPSHECQPPPAGAESTTITRKEPVNVEDLHVGHHIDDQTQAMGTSNTSHQAVQSSETHEGFGTSQCILRGQIHDKSIDVLKRLQTLEQLHQACTVNSAKFLSKACEDVIHMAKKREMGGMADTRDHERVKLIRTADDSTQTIQEQSLMSVAPKQRLSMEYLPADENKLPTKYSHVERTLPPPMEQLEVIVRATQVLDEVKRAHEAMETECALLERKHQSGLGKVLGQCHSGTMANLNLKDKKKDVNGTLAHRPLGQGRQERESKKGNVKTFMKHKADSSGNKVKHPNEEKQIHPQSKPIPTHVRPKAARRETAFQGGGGGHPIKRAPNIRPAEVTILPTPPPPPPPPPPVPSVSLLLVPPQPAPLSASGIVNTHPLQTAAIPLFTPQAVPSHETPYQPYNSEASTQTWLPGGKPASAIAVDMGTQVGESGPALPTSKTLVVTHLPLLNISTSNEESVTSPEQQVEEVLSDELKPSNSKDEIILKQEMTAQHCSANATGPFEASQPKEEIFNEVIIQGQVHLPPQLNCELSFQPQKSYMLPSAYHGTNISSEELEQQLSEHVMSQALQWVQRELIAQVMAQVSLPRDPAIAVEHDTSSSTPCSICNLQSDQHTTLQSHSDTILQWFAHVGIPVNNELVHKLVQEIVVEQSLALRSNMSDEDKRSHESPSENEDFSYTPPTSHDVSSVTPLPTPKTTPPPSPLASPVRHETPFIEEVSTPNPTPPPASPRSEQAIQLQDELLVTPQSTETEASSAAHTSVPSAYSQPSFYVQEGDEECVHTPPVTPPPAPPLPLSPADTPQPSTEEHKPPPQPATVEPPAIKEPSLSESISSSSYATHSSDLHTSYSTTDKEISLGELIKQSVSQEHPGVSLSEGEVPLSPGDARWKALQTKMVGLFPLTKKISVGHQGPTFGCRETEGVPMNDLSEVSSDNTYYGIQPLSEGQAIGDHFGGILSKINTSTPQNMTCTPNHTDDDDESTHPLTETTFTEGVHVILPSSHEPGQVVVSDDFCRTVISCVAAGQAEVASPGEVHKTVIANRLTPQSVCDLDSSEGEVKTRNGIDIIRVSRRSSQSSSESKGLKQKREMATSDQSITVSEANSLLSSATSHSNAAVAPVTAVDNDSAYTPVILVAAAKK